MSRSVLSIPGIAAVALLLAACAPAAPGPTSAPAKPAEVARPAATAAPAKPAEAPAANWQAEWDQALAAAKQEGKVAVLVPPGDAYRAVTDAFQNRYGIPVEVRPTASQADLIPSLTAERSANQFNWDVLVQNPSMIHSGLKPMGAADPVRPALILPEVLDDSRWIQGFDGGWRDNDKSLAYAFSSQVLWTAYVNRSTTPESQLSRIEQLTEPQWKGKIALEDPRVPSAGAVMMHAWLLAKGEASLRALLANQQMVVTRDRRQLAEWVLRARYPVGMGIVPGGFAVFVAEGVDYTRDVKPLIDEDPAAYALSDGTGAIGLINQAPHPNAAKVFINWLLSQEGQTVYAKATLYNSRRTDVEVVDSAGVVDPNKKYIQFSSEEVNPTQRTTIEIANEVLG
jgi:iron(III) transport system substrate-binding protein